MQAGSAIKLINVVKDCENKTWNYIHNYDRFLFLDFNFEEIDDQSKNKKVFSHVK